LPLLAEFMTDLETDVIGRGLGLNDVGVDNQVLIAVNFEIRSHPVEAIGQTLRGYMTAMKAIV
jgi:ketol-acid reductoisomerase